MVIRVRKIIWDDRNIRHIARHNVSVDEVEEIFDKYHYAGKAKYRRLLVTGETDSGRILEVPFARRGKGRIYPITAYDAGPGKAQQYLGAKRKKGGERA